MSLQRVPAAPTPTKWRVLTPYILGTTLKQQGLFDPQVYSRASWVQLHYKVSVSILAKPSHTRCLWRKRSPAPPKPQDLTLSVDNIQGWKIMYGIAVYSSVQLSMSSSLQTTLGP